ncbi:MAG TPA: right-handed parallel beta-helix repeat-containing protein [Thermoplasmata archaeon]|nr:right-handed parallel beta-helix repeat-containing protein [Thermoplasmata archaeon]
MGRSPAERLHRAQPPPRQPGEGIYLYDAWRCTVVGNMIIGDGNDGVGLSEANNVTTRNSIFHCDGRGLYAWYSTNVNFTHNEVWNCSITARTSITAISAGSTTTTSWSTMTTTHRDATTSGTGTAGTSPRPPATSGATTTARTPGGRLRRYALHHQRLHGCGGHAPADGDGRDRSAGRYPGAPTPHLTAPPGGRCRAPPAAHRHRGPCPVTSAPDPVHRSSGVAYCAGGGRAVWERHPAGGDCHPPGA